MRVVTLCDSTPCIGRFRAQTPACLSERPAFSILSAQPVRAQIQTGLDAQQLRHGRKGDCVQSRSASLLVCLVLLTTYLFAQRRADGGTPQCTASLAPSQLHHLRGFQSCRFPEVALSRACGDRSAQKPQFNSTAVYHVPRTELVTDFAKYKERVSAAERTIQRQRRPSQHTSMRILFCLGGVIPRGIRHTWPVIERRIVQHLEAHGHQVDIYGAHLHIHSVDQVPLAQEDLGMVPWTYLEQMELEDVRQAVNMRRALNASIRFQRSNGNEELQLVTENRVGEFMLRQSTIRAYDVAIVWWADFYPGTNFSVDNLLNAVMTPDSIVAIPHPRGVVNCFYIGSLLPMAKLLTRWSDVSFTTQFNGYAYEASVSDGLRWFNLSLSPASAGFFFSKIRATGIRKNDFASGGDMMTSLFKNDPSGYRMMQEYSANAVCAAIVAKCRACAACAASDGVAYSPLALRNCPTVTDVAVYLPTNHTKAWAIGSIELAGRLEDKRTVQALRGLQFDREKALGPHDQSASYMNAIPKHRQGASPQNGLLGLNITEAGAVFLLHWYREAAHHGRATYHWSSDKPEWVSGLRILSAVQLEQLSSDGSDTFTLSEASEAAIIVALRERQSQKPPSPPAPP